MAVRTVAMAEGGLTAEMSIPSVPTVGFAPDLRRAEQGGGVAMEPLPKIKHRLPQSQSPKTTSGNEGILKDLGQTTDLGSPEYPVQVQGMARQYLRYLTWHLKSAYISRS